MSIMNRQARSLRPRTVLWLAAASSAAAAFSCAYFETQAASSAVFCAFFLLFACFALLLPEKREILILSLPSAVFAVMHVAGRSYDRLDSYGLIFKSGSTLLTAAGAALALFAAALCGCLLLYRFLCRIGASFQDSPGASRKEFALYALLLFAGSLPWLALYWPGLNIADTRDQLLQFFGFPSVIGDGSVLTDHHPLLTTLLFSGFIQAGRLLGSANAGQALYSLVFLLLTSLAMAHLLTTLRKCGLPRGVSAFFAVLYALWPVPALYAFNMSKDAAAIPCVLLFCAQMIRLPQADRKDFRFCAGLFLNALLLMMLRKSAVYALLFGALLLFLSGREKRRSAAVLCGAAAVFFLYSCLILPFAGVKAGETREMLSVPLQQTARALREETDITEDERASLGRVLDAGTAADDYDPRLADPVKDRTAANFTADDLRAFAGAWLSVGLRHPACYLSAWLNMIFGYFYPSDSNTIVCLTLNSPEREGLSLTQDRSLDGLRLEAFNVITYRLRRLPGLGLLFRVSFIVYAFLLLLAMLWLRGGLRAAAPWGFFLGTLFIALLGPKNGEIRYVLPLLYALPAMLGCLLIRRGQDKEADV